MAERYRPLEAIIAEDFYLHPIGELEGIGFLFGLRRYDGRSSDQPSLVVLSQTGQWAILKVQMIPNNDLIKGLQALQRKLPRL